MTVAKRGKSFLRGLPREPVIMILLAIIAPIITIPIISHLLSLFRIEVTPQSYYTILGPVLGSALTLLTIGVSDLAKYYSSTTTLNYELDAECGSDDCSKGQIIIRVKNTGKNVAEDAYALVSIRAREIGSPEEKRYLGKFLADKDLCGNLVTTNEDPRIEDELLPWLLSPINVATKVSINPMHSRKLLVFEYERVPDGYVIRVPSEDVVGKPRVCLWLDFDTKYVFRIMVYGKSVRLPLETELYITMDKLDAIASSKAMQAMLGRIYFDEEEIAREVLNIVLKELGNNGGITERAADLRRKIFNPLLSNMPISMDGYLGIASGFEPLWNELRNKFGQLAEYLGLVFGVLHEYAVYLALAKRWNDLAYFIMNNSLLFSCGDDVCVMMKLLLNLITDEEIREEVIWRNILDVSRIYDTLKYYVPDHLRPALALLLNYGQITCKSACRCDEEKECLNQEYYKNCERILNALNGNENMVKEIASELDSVLQRHWAYKNWVGGSSEKSAPPALIKEIIDYVHNNKEPQDWGFFSRAVVELRLPTTSRLRFILILHDILRAREEFEKGNIDGTVKFVDLTEAHAIIGSIKYGSIKRKNQILFTPGVADLFGSVEKLTSAIKESKKFEISSEHILTLLRLYHYHVQTNLAET